MVWMVVRGKVRMFGVDILPAAVSTLQLKRDFHLNLGQLLFEGKFHSMVDEIQWIDTLTNTRHKKMKIFWKFRLEAKIAAGVSGVCERQLPFDSPLRRWGGKRKRWCCRSQNISSQVFRPVSLKYILKWHFLMRDCFHLIPHLSNEEKPDASAHFCLQVSQKYAWKGKKKVKSLAGLLKRRRISQFCW